jgi:hypothetical protein
MRTEIVLSVRRLLVIRRLSVLELRNGRSKEDFEHVNQVRIILYRIERLDRPGVEIGFLIGIQISVGSGVSRNVLGREQEPRYQQ